MRFHRTAFKHGIGEADINHAIDHGLAEVELDDERTLVLGPDVSAILLEVVVLNPDEDPVVIHAMRMRPQFHHFLPPSTSHEEDANDKEID